MNKLAIQLVTWNAEKYLPYLFESLRHQSFQDFKLMILDNGSVDRTIEKIYHELKTCEFDFEIIRSKENIGFACGHNQLFGQASCELVLMLNQDMFLYPDYFAKIVSVFNAHPNVGSAGGRIMRWDFHLLVDRGVEALEQSFTQLVDTLGLKVFRSRRVVDFQTGKRWPEIKHEVEKWSGVEVDVFGVSGCLPMYRRDALKEVLLGSEVFDKKYFSYKEDVDLAWRLQIAGWQSKLITDAVAYHDRSAAGPLNTGSAGSQDKDAVQNRKNKSDLANYHSYKNHIFTLLKNEYFGNYMRDWPWIEFYEWKKFFYTLIFEFKTWLAWGQILKNLPAMSRKRKMVKQMRKVKAKDLRKWWT